MTDLRQAILYEAGELVDLPDLADNRSISELIFDAAVAWADLLDQEPIDWCAEHFSRRAVQSHRCQTVGMIGLVGFLDQVPTPCQMVRVRLAAEPE